MTKTKTGSDQQDKQARQADSNLPTLGWERAAYILLAVVALAIRLWGLGERAISFDECQHAYFSWQPYSVGSIFKFDPISGPITHGPFLFLSTTLMYALFGVSDFTLRLMPAFFGAALAVLPWFLRKWMGRLGALAAGVMLAVSPSLLFYSRDNLHEIYGCVWAVLMVIGLFRFLDERKDRYLYLFAAAAMLYVSTKAVVYIVGFICVVFLVVGLFWERLPEVSARKVRVVGLAVGAALALLALWLTQRPRPAGQGNSELLVVFSVLVCFFVAAVLVGWAWKQKGKELVVADGLKAIGGRSALIAAAIVVMIWVLMYSSFLTSPRSLSGPFNLFSYWLSQHGGMRGGQPWYYIVMLLLMYEFLPFLLSLAGIVYYAFVRKHASGERDSQPFVPFLIFWIITAIAVHSWVGEKMPQHVLYTTVPVVLLAGRVLQDWVGGVDWSAAWKKGFVPFVVVLPAAIYAFIRALSARPFTGLSQERLNQTMTWLVALIVFALLVWALYRLGERLGRKLSLQASFVSIALVLLLFTIRFTWMASFVNYDTAKEILVYAHGTMDAKATLDEITDISRRTVGDTQIKVAYDTRTGFPFTNWYLRDFPNAVSFDGKNPSREALDAPIVIVHSLNDDKVRPILSKEYDVFPRRLMWWPVEDYKGLTPKRIFNALKNPTTRKEIWDILWNRKYKYSLSEWPYREEFNLYIRNSLTAQIWNYSTGGVAAAPTEPVEDIYLKKHQVVASVMQVGYSGQGEGQFADPRGVAVDAQGNVHVADTNNHRIQVFDSNGAFLRQWGVQGDGDGQFNEPWGIAVDGDGNVYVADTWNHRIQKFDKNGKFLAKWGEFRDSQGTTELEQGHFYGPRALAVALDGTLLVVDTGNERVERFGSDGKFLGAYGGFGAEDGQFWEPVGIAVDGDGNVYIADTWNQRVQKFDKDFRYVTKWGINTWVGQSVVNKPCLAADSRGHVYASDPEGYRLLEFTGSGEFVASYGQYGSGIGDFNLPIGLAVDAGDNLWVADSGNHRIMKFGPLGR